MKSPDLDFRFIEDAGLLTVLEDYYRQARRAASVDSYLGVIVGCGSVVEGS